MKKTLALLLACAVALALAACGSAPTAAPTQQPVELVDVTTASGITMKLPSDMTLQDSGAYTNAKKTDVVSFGEIAASEAPLADWTEDTVLAQCSAYTNVVVKSFENGKTINGNDALVAGITFTSPSGIAIVDTLVVVSDGTTNYVISLMYPADNVNGVLAQNTDAIVNSIQLAAK